MFYSFNRLIDGWNIVTAGGGKKEDIPSVGTIEKRVRRARLRIVFKLLFTVIVIGACAVMLSLPNIGEALIRLAYIGIGFVIGYWFR